MRRCVHDDDDIDADGDVGGVGVQFYSYGAHADL